jgi:hypothetical protein
MGLFEMGRGGWVKNLLQPVMKLRAGLKRGSREIVQDAPRFAATTNE